MAIFAKKTANVASSATTAKIPLKNNDASKSERMRSATARAQSLKTSSSVRKPLTPSQRLVPKASDAVASVVTTEHKVRTSTPNKQLGQLLLKAGKITDAQLNKALLTQETAGGLLGQLLGADNACAPSDISGVLKQQRTITTVNLAVVKVDERAVKLLERSFCAKNRVFPFELFDNQLCVAMSNALDTTTKSEVKEKTGQTLKIFDASNNDIQIAVKKYFAEQATVNKPTLAEAAEKEEQVTETEIVVELPGDVKTVAEVATDDEEMIAIDESGGGEVKGGEMPSIAENLETLDDSAIAAIRASKQASVAEIPAGALYAIPISDDYCASILTDNGVLSAEKCWLSKINATNATPAVPLFYNIAN